MEESNLDFDQVKRYLNGEMDDKEKGQFEDRINNDPELAQQVNLDQVLLEGIQLHYRGELKEKLRALDQDNFQVGRQAFPLYRALAIAAGIVLVLVVGFLAFENKPDGPALYATYFKPYYNVVSDLERGETASGSVDPYQLYESGQYQQANQSFEELLLADPENNQLIFYNGLSYLNAGLTAKAIDNLSKVAGEKDFLLSGTALWYLGLAYLKEGRIDEAVKTFTSLEEIDNGYAARAGEVLKELE